MIVYAIAQPAANKHVYFAWLGKNTTVLVTASAIIHLLDYDTRVMTKFIDDNDSDYTCFKSGAVGLKLESKLSVTRIGILTNTYIKFVVTARTHRDKLAQQVHSASVTGPVTAA